MLVTNRGKGLNPIGRAAEELRTDNTVQEVVTKTVPNKKKCNQAKWLSEEGLQTDGKKRSQRQGRKGKIYAFECRVPKKSTEREEISVQKEESTNRMGKTRSLQEN